MGRDLELQEPYSVYCTECGEKIGKKFFRMDDLLKQYYLGKSYIRKVNRLVSYLRIGAWYGGPVLPQMPPLRDAKGVWHLEAPKAGDRGTLREFCGQDSEITLEQLTPIDVNIAAIVGQFCLTTGFWELYPMLGLCKKMAQDEENAEDQLTPEETKQWENYCDQLNHIPGVKTEALTSGEDRNAEIRENLQAILLFAEKEAETPELKNFSTQQLYVGWRYKLENDRKMPYSLLVRGKQEGVFDGQDCCCDKCFHKIPWVLGAYPQRIIGILGTQAVGKTTFLMALADVLQEQSFKKMTITHDALDPQWKRAEYPNGPLHQYKSGLVPSKTAVEKNAASALSFLIKKDAAAEPVMYTLADIPGEAFYTENEYSSELINTLRRLLLASNALFLVVNRDQLKKLPATATMHNGTEEEAPAAENKNDLVKNAASILTAVKGYLPTAPISTAVVLAAADKIGNLRSELGLAFDLRKLPVLVEKGEKYIYNSDMMNTASQAVGAYMDRNFQQFMHNLCHGFVPAGSATAAFALSSGTQYAVDVQPQDETKAEAEERYARVCQARFGVVSPMLWLLAQDKLLDGMDTEK